MDDISTGIFLSEDPLVQLTLNAFNYTEGNPLTQIDPLGLFSMDDFVFTGPSIITNEMKDNAIDTGAFARRNAGYISSALGLSGIIATGMSSGSGAPIGALAMTGATIFSLIALEYEIANCIGYTKDKSCDYLSLTTSIAGLTTAGISSAIVGTEKFGHKAVDFENASFVLGIIGSAFSAATSTINSINKNNLKEDNLCK